MLKNLFNSGKCLLGFHQGEWQYESPSSCLQYQVCEHCKKRSTKTEHTWNEWDYQTEDNCQQIRVCLRCQNEETQTLHVWSADAYYKKDGDCTAVNYCERCGEEKLYGTVHQWEQWVYTSADACDQIQQCSRCETLGGGKRVEHTWDSWQYSAFYNAQVIVCQHCGLMPFKFDSTTYSLTIRDVETLFNGFARVKDVSEIAKLIRNNISMFDQPNNPILTAYLHFIDIHMPEGELKGFYGTMGENCKLMSGMGIETVLSALDGVRSQPEQNPWDLASSALIAAARKKQPPNLDKRLIGHWRCTDSMGGGAFSSVTDYHQIFEENGDFQTYKRTITTGAGLGSDKRTSPINGKWSAQNNILTINYEDEISNEMPYQFHDKYLVFPNSGNTRFWEKTR